MDFSNYADKKAIGKVEIIKAGGGIALVIKRFDVYTGEPTAPEIETIDVSKLEAEKIFLQGKIKDIDDVIADASALEE